MGWFTYIHMLYQGWFAINENIGDILRLLKKKAIISKNLPYYFFIKIETLK